MGMNKAWPNIYNEEYIYLSHPGIIHKIQYLHKIQYQQQQYQV